MPVETVYKLAGGCFMVTFSSVLGKHRSSTYYYACYSNQCHVFLPGVMLIMVYIGYSKHKGYDSALLRMFYRDGVFYFACLSSTAVQLPHKSMLLTPAHSSVAALAIFNSIMNFAAPLAYKFLFIECVSLPKLVPPPIR